jgi:hypothetical protein
VRYISYSSIDRASIPELELRLDRFYVLRVGNSNVRLKGRGHCFVHFVLSDIRNKCIAVVDSRNNGSKLFL